MIETSTPVSPESEDQRLQIYNPNPAASWSVILTPLFGAYIIRENWLVLGNAEAAKRSFFWLIGLGLLYFLFFFTGLFDDFDYLVHLAALIIWYILECKPQVKFKRAEATIRKASVAEATGDWICNMVDRRYSEHHYNCYFRCATSGPILARGLQRVLSGNYRISC